MAKQAVLLPGDAVRFTRASGNDSGKDPFEVESVSWHNGQHFYRLVGLTGVWVRKSLRKGHANRAAIHYQLAGSDAPATTAS